MSKLYNEIKKFVEEYNLKTRFNVVAFCVGYYSAVNSDIFDVINQLYLDEIIKE